VIGAHAAGFNTNTVGISVIGDYTSASPGAATIEGVSRIAGWKLYTGGVDPAGSGTFTSAGGPRYAPGTVVNIANVVGHTDVGSTACPGRIHSYLGQIRQRAQEWKNHSLATYGPFGNLGGPPFGYFDGIYQNGNRVSTWGWAIDPDPHKERLSVHIILNNRDSWAVDAHEPRPDVAAAFPGYGNEHGFGKDFTLPPGVHEFCAVAINVGYGSNPAARPSW
jgi:hypothetical protein